MPGLIGEIRLFYNPLRQFYLHFYIDLKSKISIFKIVKYRVQVLSQICNVACPPLYCCYLNNYPIVLSFTCYDKSIVRLDPIALYT